MLRWLNFSRSSQNIIVNNFSPLHVGIRFLHSSALDRRKDLDLSILYGALIGLFLALIIQPLLENRAQGFLLRFISNFWYRKKGSIAGEWCSIMTLSESDLDRSNEIKNIKISQVTKQCGTSEEVIEQYYDHVITTDYAAELKRSDGLPSLSGSLAAWMD